MPEKHKRHSNTKCLICSKEVYKRPSALKANNGRVFCSLACYGISNRREVPCVVCGKLILSGLNKKTCSRGCSNKHRTGIKYLQNSPSSKVVTYKRIKMRLLELRGKVCERCGYNKHEILQIHHKDRDRKNSEYDNLELVCPNCHFEEHYLKHPPKK